MLADRSKTRIENLLRESLADARRWTSRAWKLLKAYPLYLAVLVMIGYAVWDARTPVTMIVPFQLPKNDLPFTGELVADAVQDGLKSIGNEIEEEKQDTSLGSSDTGLRQFRNMLIPKFSRVQAPPRFSVEIKGVSYERVLSIIRAVLGTETQISGDVVVDKDKFFLVARSTDAGPWKSATRPITPEALQEASKELAEQIVAAEDPTLAAVALLKEGRVDQGLAELVRARALNPSDGRLKLNLCGGFAANRRYPDAIKCYNDILDPRGSSSQQELRESVAQAYYLNGDRDKAIEIYKELAHKEGYRHARLGLGEVLDDTGNYLDAVREYDEFLAAEHLERNLAIAHVKKGLALAHLNRHDEAQREYDTALKYSPRDILILVHQGLELAEATDLDAGIAQIQSAMNENQNSDSLPFARFQLGQLLERKGDWRGALDEYQKAAQQRPTYVEAHLKLAHALVHQGKQEQAFEEYNTVAKLSALDLERGYSQMFADQWLGNDLRDAGRYAGAASAYQAAIHIKADDSAAHCQLALILASQRRLIQAVHEYGAALVPAKLNQLNDTECLTIADHVLDHAVAGPETDAKVAVAELRKLKEAAKPMSRTVAQNTRLVGSDKATVAQAVLRGPR
jgi:tetratricopeptide (TPR) repeat protein